jgi:hypothetical protein
LLIIVNDIIAAGFKLTVSTAITGGINVSAIIAFFAEIIRVRTVGVCIRIAATRSQFNDSIATAVTLTKSILDASLVDLAAIKHRKVAKFRYWIRRSWKAAVVRQVTRMSMHDATGRRAAFIFLAFNIVTDTLARVLKNGAIGCFN